ncbi:MAG: tyrosine--tRNA ligase [Spirochaetales bacterium]|nr:MAG: tyrosine--tRNA ligase [Spirochaetales bacterium]
MESNKEAWHGVRNEGIVEAFARTTDEIVSLAEFRALLDSGRKLKIKFGADVTAPFLHLGHAVNLWMLREMQERGHLVQFLVGDFTTLIGDPTGRDVSRPPRSAAEIQEDAGEFIRQVGTILITDDPERFEVRFNSSWWSTKPLAEFLELLGSVTASRLLSRDMFKARIESGKDVRAHELVYPLLQGWDSVELDSDLTIVGSDQLFNESMGRFFQERSGKAPQVIITTRITPGLDGVRKQSKSLNNFVALDDGPRQAFGKVMSLPDELITQWFEVYTQEPLPIVRELEVGMNDGSLNPRDAKLRLARAIVGRLHGEGAALTEEAWFQMTFSGGNFPEDALVVFLLPGEWRVLDLLAELEPLRSRSKIRRLLAEGAIEVDGRKPTSADETVNVPFSGDLRIRLGRRRFARVRAGEPTCSSDIAVGCRGVGPSGYGC